ncbi:hypothetical protein FC83_GL002015 [Agrilactobacillus composti DSM 18527 = JCM 14202]|jgi:predicted component of type VI protein secretion system|uniref:Uncharacterized protein n=1 Tax=Agrilactobacillus composti DSM 18527 = JCM 14202 TaxID=1423734 RepID=X0PD01_9LACO|nr:hypothetical protein [Agrilactobacillus composti]KRM34877.1 hypothetical protein FC83_GL002015 [Agrilactobacillus composti DSM 18527 = JCM 14202]MCH4169935.1 hypothetical protein [Lactobacillus sp.]GAF38749.1 hypothetical protein JCM14202_577 [Agrilactobacillus composti DSM 18527 = JCM 14202]
MTPDQNDVISTMLFDVQYPNIYALTESGHIIQVNVTDQQKKDPIFWRILDKIRQAKIWVPLLKKQHQLLDNDWLAVE